jgi:predicted N-acetyltransferase YhbS
VGTDPPHERRGAASLLIRWGLEHCRGDNVPAYLESTVEAGPLYERHGFKAVENLSMVLEGMARDSIPIVYEETCFIFNLALPAVQQIVDTLQPEGIPNEKLG